MNRPLSTTLLVLALHVCVMAINIQLMAQAVDDGEPGSARTVFVVLMCQGWGVGWATRGIWDQFLARRIRREQNRP